MMTKFDHTIEEIVLDDGTVFRDIGIMIGYRKTEAITPDYSAITEFEHFVESANVDDWTMNPDEFERLIGEDRLQKINEELTENGGVM